MLRKDGFAWLGRGFPSRHCGSARGTSTAPRGLLPGGANVNTQDVTILLINKTYIYSTVCLEKINETQPQFSSLEKELGFFACIAEL